MLWILSALTSLVCIGVRQIGQAGLYMYLDSKINNDKNIIKIYTIIIYYTI